jgi:hypothetical protein
MTLLETRLETFAAEERLFEAVLGMLGIGARVEALSSLVREDGELGADGALADFFLGVIAVTRTLRSTLDVLPDGIEPSGCAAARSPIGPKAISLR